MGKDEIMELVERKDLRKIWVFIDEVLDGGIAIDDVLDLGELYDGFFEEYYEKILNLGADPLKLFKLNERWYHVMTTQPRRLSEIFVTYAKYGVSEALLKNWLTSNIPGHYFVKYADFFKPFGIDPAAYKKAYMRRLSFRDLWDDIVFGSSPEVIGPNDVVRYFPIDVIEHEFNRKHRSPFGGSTIFIAEFAKAGGNIDLLAEEMFKGSYPEDEDKLLSLVALVNHGAIKIEANKIIDALTPMAYNYRDRQSVKKVNRYFYDHLKDYADAEHLAKLEL